MKKRQTWVQQVKQMFAKKLTSHIERCRECRDLNHDCGAAVRIRKLAEWTK